MLPRPVGYRKFQTMNSRERVLAAFAHQQPDRVPIWCGASDEFWSKAKKALALDDEGLRHRFGDDFRRVFARFSGPEPVLAPSATYCTPFGVQRTGLGYGQPLAHPLATATLNQVHDYAWPSAQWIDVTQIRPEAESHNGEYAILGGDWSPFWHDLIDLLGMETVCLKMFDEPELIDAILDHVVDYYLAVSQKIFDAAADAIDIFFIGNDFGSQTGPLMGISQFKRFILPHLQRLIDLGHQYGLLVQLHCCGGFEPLIPVMIAAGLDGLHAVQPSCRGMELATLKTKYGRQIVFNGAIDSKTVLLDGPSTEFVRARTRAVLDVMASGGGYIAGASHDAILGETPLENVLAMYDAVREYGGPSRV